MLNFRSTWCGQPGKPSSGQGKRNSIFRFSPSDSMPPNSQSIVRTSPWAVAGSLLTRIAWTLCGLRARLPNHGQHTGTPARMLLPALNTASSLSQISGGCPAN
ncbi:hypothetical protein D3C80_1758730 [compost metagenome]